MGNLGPSQYILEDLSRQQSVVLPQQRADARVAGGGPLLGRIAKGSSCAKGDEKKSDLYLKLEELGYPEESLSSMERCGQQQGLKLLESCDKCGNVRVIDLTHHCNLRTCERCCEVRKRRIRKQYLSFLDSLKKTSSLDLRFLTISPKNYENIEYGLKDIRMQFKKFLNAVYDKKTKQRVKDRIKGGIYIIETRNLNRYGETHGWNIHIHAIIYAQRLDNTIRGKCLRCKQSYIKLDGISGKYHCANRYCNSLDVIVDNKDSKIVSIYKKVNKTECNIDIKTLKNNLFTLNYLLKYISSTKNNFKDIESKAQYINAIHHHMLLSPFGCFLKLSVNKSVSRCLICNGIVKYTLDMQIIYLLKGSPWDNYDPPPHLEEMYIQVQIDKYFSDEGPRPEGAVVPEERPPDEIFYFYDDSEFEDIFRNI